MNILVTGGSGFIGSYIVDKLIDAGHSVNIFDIVKPRHRNDVEEGIRLYYEWLKQRK